MNNKAKQPEAAEPLHAVVEDAYRVFCRHKPPALPLDVCLNCCMSADLEREMRRLPLRELTARHFYEYNTSAKSEVQPADEILYLLPRMLELIAKEEDVHHSTELFLDRVGRCAGGSLAEAEQRLLDRFALSFFAQSICKEIRWFQDPLAVLLMFDIGGLDVAPLMDHWTSSNDPWSTVHFVRSTYWDFWSGQEYENAFAGDRPAFRARLRTWVLDPATRRHFADRLMKPDFLCLAQQQRCTGHVPFNSMVDAVFDHLTR